MVVGEFACQYEIRQIRTLKPHISLRCQEVVLKLNALSLVLVAYDFERWRHKACKLEIILVYTQIQSQSKLYSKNII